jgi:transposase
MDSQLSKYNIKKGRLTMLRTRRSFTREFKISIIRELESGKSAAEVSRQNQLNEALISKWRKEYENDPEKAFSGNGNAKSESARISELERTIGKLYLENDFLKKTLKRLEENLQEYRRRESVK